LRDARGGAFVPRRTHCQISRLNDKTLSSLSITLCPTLLASGVQSSRQPCSRVQQPRDSAARSQLLINALLARSATKNGGDVSLGGRGQKKWREILVSSAATRNINYLISRVCVMHAGGRVSAEGAKTVCARAHQREIRARLPSQFNLRARRPRPDDAEN
jgi:hypothetical protein